MPTNTCSKRTSVLLVKRARGKGVGSHFHVRGEAPVSQLPLGAKVGFVEVCPWPPETSQDGALARDRRGASASRRSCATGSAGKMPHSPRSLACSCRSDAFPRDRAHHPAPWSLGLTPDATASASGVVSACTQVRGGLDHQGARGQPSRMGMAIVLGTALDRPALRRRWSPALQLYILRTAAC
eukprot:SAG25_NODE_495_length_7403_cov_7.136911_8_plen_183_part_00